MNRKVDGQVYYPIYQRDPDEGPEFYYEEDLRLEERFRFKHRSKRVFQWDLGNLCVKYLMKEFSYTF